MLTRPGRMAVWIGAGVIIVVGAPIAYASDGGLQVQRSAPVGCSETARHNVSSGSATQAFRQHRDSPFSRSAIDGAMASGPVADGMAANQNDRPGCNSR